MKHERLVGTSLDDQSLPAWTYTSQRFLDLERRHVFAPSWQLVCHESDVPAPGDYHTLDILGEPLAVLRGRDGVLRGFHNVCRHRASRLLDGVQGNAGKAIVCPYHAWRYELDGRLSAVPHRDTFPTLDIAGLAPLDIEIFFGFVFVRMEGDGPSVAAMMAPYAAELAPFRFEELQPQGRVTLRRRNVNWKNVADNYGDGLHISVAHPGLTRLFGRSYSLDAQDWADRMTGDLEPRPSRNWSERLYQQLLPADAGRRWLYVKLWPNLAFDIYPDQVDFMQFIPVSPTETIIREIAYVLPDARREMRAARYLNWRINRQVNAEDTVLIERVQAGMASSSYTSGPLSTEEVCLRSFARRMRATIPEACLEREPS